MSPVWRLIQSSWLIPAFKGACVVGLAAASGCAGPTTPLGAIWDLHPETSDLVPEMNADGVGRPVRSRRGGSRGIASLLSFVRGRDPEIRFDPPRQVLHGAHTLKLIIDDPRGIADDSGLRIRYHGHDVTRSFLMQARFSHEPIAGGGTRLIAEVPWVRLSPMSEHRIEVDYARPGSERRTSSQLRPPICRAFDRSSLKGLDTFKPEPQLVQSIEVISREMGFNPAFTAALIAQESGFNPQSVSIARAMGLTQVAPLAEEEVSDVFSRWPRYEGSNTFPAPVLKYLVMSGEINAQNEWRLNPERSIRGGLLFAQRLADRWVDSEGFSKVSWTGGAGSTFPQYTEADVEVARTRLVLASYNSGYSRVAQAINRHGAAWLTAPELREARRYVNRIFSFCDAFERAPSSAAAALDSQPFSQGSQWVSGPRVSTTPLTSRGEAP